MYRPLAPCPSCSCHVLTSEVACPFCNAALPVLTTSELSPPRGVSRAAALAFGAALAVTGCDGETTQPTPAPKVDAGPDDPGSPIAKYGGAPVVDDAGSPVAEYGASPIDDGGAVPKYGGPPFDGG